MTSYIFVLERNGKAIDETSLDENDVKYAEELFYGEFGHKKQDDDRIYLLREEKE